METMHAYLPEIISFYHVAHFKSFTRAAAALQLSKAQLSRQVKTLEVQLKAQLFHRTTRSLTLTEEGRSLLFFSEGIVKLSAEAAQTMQELTSQNSGIIRLTVPSSLGEWLSVPISKKLRQQFPDLRVELDFSNQRKDLIKDNFDFALRAMEEKSPDLICRLIGQVKDVIVAAPSLVGKKGDGIQEPADLRNYPCLMTSHNQKWASWNMMKHDLHSSVEVTGNFATSNYSTNRLMCLGGLGVAKLPLYLVSNDIQRGDLINLLPGYEISTHALHLVYPLRSYRPAKQKIFKDILLDWFSTQNFAFLKQQGPIFIGPVG